MGFFEALLSCLWYAAKLLFMLAWRPVVIAVCVALIAFIAGRIAKWIKSK